MRMKVQLWQQVTARDAQERSRGEGQRVGGECWIAAAGLEQKQRGANWDNQGKENICRVQFARA